MKQFKFLAMAIFAMVMSIGFVACSSDDDDNNGGGSITSGKKLVRISCEYKKTLIPQHFDLTLFIST